MTTRRRLQRSLFEPVFPENPRDLYEPWMLHADRLLDDDQLVDSVYDALAKRHANSRRHGRPSTPAEVVLRLLVLKHVRNWSYEVLVREVRANVVYRDFCRIGFDVVPDDKTLGRIARDLGPAVVETLHRRLVEIALQERVVTGRKLRVDTTVVETNVHYPTDSSLLNDGLRVLTRTMRKIEEVADGAGERLRDRMRSVTSAPPSRRAIACWPLFESNSKRWSNASSVYGGRPDNASSAPIRTRPTSC